MSNTIIFRKTRSTLSSWWLGGASALLTAAGAFYLWSGDDASSNPSAVGAIRRPTAGLHGDASSPSAAETSNAEHQALLASIKGRRLGGSRFFANDQDIEAARTNEQLLALENPEMARNNLVHLTERQKTDGRAFIRYDMRTLESRVVGDELEILLPSSGVSVKARIDAVERVDSSLRWSGRILDFQEGGQFHITHAADDGYAVGTFETPLGAYSMEVKNGIGWVVDQAKDFHLPADGHDALVHHEAAAPAQPE